MRDKDPPACQPCVQQQCLPAPPTSCRSSPSLSGLFCCCSCLCRYAGGDSIKHTVFDNVDRATLKVYSSQENVAGVKIPKFESVSEPGETKMELTGIWGWAGAVAAVFGRGQPGASD